MSTILRHVASVLNPRDHGLTPYHIRFTQEESVLVPSILDDGLRYRHPETVEEVIVWAKNTASIPEVLTYHHDRQWRDVRILE